jgi:hypothetical protein
MSDWRYNFQLGSPTTQRCAVDSHGLSPSSYFKINGHLMKLNLTRIDRTPQIFFARRIAHVVSYEEAWGEESGFNILRVARAIHLFNARHCDAFTSFS